MNNKTNTDLLPCPFCESTDLAIEVFDEGWKDRIRCHTCQAQGPPHRTKPAAIENWNRRYDHAAAELRWIPIRSADDLPKENGYYLVTCGSVGIDPDDTTSHELNWFGGKWYLPSDEMIEMDGVIAWMKKPKPYTEPADNIGEGV